MRRLVAVAACVLGGLGVFTACPYSVPRCESDEQCVERSGGRPAYCHREIKICFAARSDGGADAGEDGGTCVPDCASGTRCVDGRCVCDSASCPTGCCSSGRCVQPSESACGSNGAACVACDPERSTGCTSGACRCGNQPQCPDGSFCVAGECTRFWVDAGTMLTTRGMPSLVQLPSGEVAVVGGYVTDSAAPFLEIHNLQTGEFAAGPAPAVVRVFNGTVALRNGRVLVLGGIAALGGTNPYTRHCELFDPFTRSWADAGMMSTARVAPAVVLLNNGFVVVAGGSDGSSVTSATDVYHPVSAIFYSAGPLNVARALAPAVALADGSGLIVGGAMQDGGVTSTAELFDPQTGQWRMTGQLQSPRIAHTATLLPNGRVLVAGGLPALGMTTLYSTTEIFDPATGTWSPGPAMNVARAGHQAVRLPNGAILVIGGTPSGSVEILDPVRLTWKEIAPLIYYSAKSSRDA